MRSTHITKPQEVQRKWFVIDADGQNLGRISSQIAHILRGKHKPTFSPSVDTGDYVIVINAEKVAVTGRKLDQKTYVRHSGHIGRRKETKMKDMLAKKPEFILWHSVKGMLPKNNLGREMFKKFHVYAGSEHKHQAQQPEVLKLDI
ncbi:MAG: 50S ribosomal protein L13 [Defluviitaleaceae bacterium]|nr:50S ribosomal protein L13 [Defluviitaleaceae bacterium]MCL2261892.1 50S ribosomal protein L13 [Defluviitaleaceae bacterium]